MPALFDRDTNVPTMLGQNPFQSLNATAASNGQENQAHEAEQHKQAKAAVDKSNPLYVSPSDAIMSPASQKLSSFKQRQINKQHGSDSTRRALFARNMSANNNNNQNSEANAK